MARPTSDPKTEKLILRVNEEDRQYIEKCAELNNMSVSDYLRMTIRNDRKMQDISLLVEFSGGDMDIFLEDLWNKLNEGIIELEDGKIENYKR